MNNVSVYQETQVLLQGMYTLQSTVVRRARAKRDWMFLAVVTRVRVVGDNNVLAHFKGGDRTADFFDISNRLVSEIPWNIGSTSVAVIEVEIGATDG